MGSNQDLSFLSHANSQPSQKENNENMLMEILQTICELDSFNDLINFLQTMIHDVFEDCGKLRCFRISKNHPEIILDMKTLENVQSSLVSSCKCAAKCIQFKKIAKNDWLVSNKYIDFCEEVIVLMLHSEKDFVEDDILFVVGSGKLKLSEKDLQTIFKHATVCYERIYKRVSIVTDGSINKTADLLLSGDLDKTTDATSIQKILNLHISAITSCEHCCILIRVKEIGQLVCQAVDDQKLNFEVFRSLDEGIFKLICNQNNSSYTNQNLNLDESEQLSSFLGFHIKSILTVPIINKPSSDVNFYVCLINKRYDEIFESCDVLAVTYIMSKIWRTLESSLMLQREIKSRQESEAMLQIAKNLFTYLGDVRLLLGEIIQSARSLTSAERCSVFLKDETTMELVATIFDGISTIEESVEEIRFPLTQGIAGLVATTGKTLNIADVYQHPLFYKGVDEATGFRTRNILCFPIKDLNGKVVGVSQLCNKIKGRLEDKLQLFSSYLFLGPCFTSYDVEIAEKFSVFSGISISHSLLYKQVLESDARSKLANELMLYHMNIDVLEIHSYLNLCLLKRKLTEISLDISDFNFLPRSLSNDMKLVACVLMYDDLGLTARFHISRKTLIHFMLMVRKGYRDTPYHNWDHAFSVLHHAYLLIKNLKLDEIYEMTDVIALLTAAVCHDLDHRGTNNSFQTSSQSVLADLYSSEGSVLERHHLAQTMCVLNSSGCDIFENMTHKEYRRTLAKIKHAILATDVATHLKLVPQFESFAEETKLNLKDARLKDLIYSLCMTACDLSDSTKDWTTITATSKLIYNEFFSQGDMEKRMGNRPAVMNDRDRACLPELQINFMNFIAKPAYRLFATFFPDYSPVYERFQLNLSRWKLVHKITSEEKVPNSTFFDHIGTKDFTKKILDQYPEI